MNDRTLLEVALTNLPRHTAPGGARFKTFDRRWVAQRIRSQVEQHSGGHGGAAGAKLILTDSGHARRMWPRWRPITSGFSPIHYLTCLVLPSKSNPELISTRAKGGSTKRSNEKILIIEQEQPLD